MTSVPTIPEIFYEAHSGPVTIEVPQIEAYGLERCGYEWKYALSETNEWLILSESDQTITLNYKLT